MRVLFVGNSLDGHERPPRGGRRPRPRASGRPRIEYRTLAPGGVSLEDHWNAGAAPAELASGGWDAVVLQQGPSALLESQVNLKEWATRFADAAREHGTRPFLLTVWPESYRVGALDDVIRSHANAAKAAHAQLLPAGAAWRAAWMRNPALPLYGRDGFHPSRLGTHLTARRRPRRADQDRARVAAVPRSGPDRHPGACAAAARRRGQGAGGCAMSDARRAALAALIDHAPTFPPASLPVEEAIAEDRRARADEHAWLLRRLVWPASQLGALGERGARALRPPRRRRTTADPRAEAIETRWDEQLQALIGEVYVELPLGDGLEEKVAVLAERGYRAKVRCGGPRSRRRRARAASSALAATRACRSRRPPAYTTRSPRTGATASST